MARKNTKPAPVTNATSWPAWTFIGEVDSPRALVEALQNADLNLAYEEVAGQADDVQAFAEAWDRAANRARAAALGAQQGEN